MVRIKGQGQGRARGRGRGGGSTRQNPPKGPRPHPGLAIRFSKRLAFDHESTETSLSQQPQQPAVPPNSPASSSIIVMAPLRNAASVEDSLKEIIQNLFDVQSQVHGYQPETHSPLIEKIIELTHSLAHLQTLTADTTHPIATAKIPPEILDDYVDQGRNPDIYQRDFVELVARGNAVLAGKSEAFRSFAEILADEMRREMPETEELVDRVMRNAGLMEAQGGAGGEEEEGKGKRTPNGAG